jgi:hypothetical protein
VTATERIILGDGYDYSELPRRNRRHSNSLVLKERNARQIFVTTRRDISTGGTFEPGAITSIVSMGARLL